MNRPKQLLTTLALLSSAQIASAANIYWDGGTTGVWSDATLWSTDSAAATPNPGAAPTTGDVAIFNRTGSLGGSAVTLNGNQNADGIQFNNTSTMSLRSTLAGQILNLGTGGITHGSAQVDLGGGGTQAIVISLMGSQSWVGSSSGLLQLNNGAAVQGITNGTSGAVNLTFSGAGTGNRTINGIIDNGSLGGTTALTINTTGSFGTVGLNGNNTYTGGTTLTRGFLGLNNALALGGSAGAFTIDGTAQTSAIVRTITSSVVGGVTLTNNNAQNWNSDFTLGGGQSINFGTGAVTMGANTTINLNPSTTAAGTSLTNYTQGGNISGAFSLTTTTQTPGGTGYLPGINSQLTLNGTNAYTGGTNINGGLVKFGSLAAIPSTGLVNLNGGAISVSGAFATLSDILSNASITKTSGALALTSDSSENFTAPNANISVGAALGSTVKYTGTITTFNNNYVLGGGGGTIVFTGNNAFNGAKSITTLGGPTASNLGGGGTVIITGINTASGAGTNTGVSVGMGTLQVDSIGSLNGPATNLGQFTIAANGTINIGGPGSYSQLRYTGVGETTDRGLNFAGFSGANAGFDASGSGALTFSNTTFNQSGSAASKNLTLRGINTDANTIVAGIGTSGTNNGPLNLSKQQRGNWTLQGSNNFGAVTVNGGTLTADYTNVATVFTTSTPNVTLGGGTLVIKGNAAGTTAQTVGNVVLTGAVNPLPATGQSTLRVIGNGTPGSAVLTTSNTWTRNAGTYLNVNLVNGGQITASPTLTNGIFGGGGIVVSDTSGTDFATVSGVQIAKLGSTTALVASGGAAGTNYLLSGSQTLTGAVSANTVRIDTSSTGGTLALGAFNITNTTTEYLMSGGNDYTISGTQLGAAGTTVGLANWGTGKLTVSSLVTSTGGILNKTGTGLVELTGANAFTGATNIYGGVLRLSNTAYGTSNILLNTGGILEIGADLNGGTAGDFSRQVGTGASQIQWANGDGGFSAFGGNRTVNLTNALGTAGGQLVWGSTNGNNFVTAPNASPLFVKDGFALLLSSSTSDSTITFQNAIDLVNMPRAIVVGNGSALVDAIMSGVLSSSDYSGGIDKSGAGTLALTAVNTYTGQTRVLEGQLNLGVANAIANSSGVVLKGGTLQSAFNQSLGALNVSASSILDLSTGGTFAFADSSALSWTGILSVVGTFTDGSSVRFGTSSSGLTGTQLSQITINGFAATIDSAGFLVSAIPEPSTFAALMGLAGLGCAFMRRRRNS
jgi:autotransporter-associated beta strand protein